MRKRFYEIYYVSHLILTELAIVAIYFHCPISKIWELPAALVFASLLVQALVIAANIYALFRNANSQMSFGRAWVQNITYQRGATDVIAFTDAFTVYLKIPRPWDVKPGQWVYLTVPEIDYCCQSHPFYISQVDHGHGDQRMVLIVWKENGFTRKLVSHVTYEWRDDKAMKAIVNGPYGKEICLDSYHTIILCASGIGIAGLIPYITELREGFHSPDGKSKKVVLLWEIESECKFTNSVFIIVTYGKKCIWHGFKRQ
jgi:predicted ferric reductase